MVGIQTFNDLMMLVDRYANVVAICNNPGGEAETMAYTAIRDMAISISANSERYDWLRSQPDSTEIDSIDVVHWVSNDVSANMGTSLRGDQLDAAIDAAMKEQQ